MYEKLQELYDCSNDECVFFKTFPVAYSQKIIDMKEDGTISGPTQKKLIEYFVERHKTKMRYLNEALKNGGLDKEHFDKYMEAWDEVYADAILGKRMRT